MISIFELMNTSKDITYDYDVLKIATHIMENNKMVSDYMMENLANYVLNYRMDAEMFDPPK